MIKLITSKDMHLVMDLPQLVREYIADDLAILDENYGTNRDENSGEGGVVIINPSTDDIKQLEMKYHFEAISDYAEYVDRIDDYTKSLYLIGSEFGIVIYQHLVLLYS